MVDSVVSLEGVSKEFGDTLAVDNIDLEVKRGELLTLLGPSGCGKTTTLRMIAGFETPTSGVIRLNGDNVINTPTYERDIGMVFQHFALFPHMTVADNIAFGPKMQGLPNDEIDARVGSMLEMVGLPDVGDRHPQNLSGGQQQRIALVRSLVLEPDVLLLDEPLSSLDKKLRQNMRIEIMRIQRELDVTMIYVTHNQAEALSMSDRMAVMDRGQIRQIGTPSRVYQEPADEFIADFIGSANLVKGHLNTDENIYNVETVDGIKIETDQTSVTSGADISDGDMVTVLLRPERMTVGEKNHRNTFSATINEITYFGSNAEYYVELESGTEFVISEPIRGRINHSVGEVITVSFDASAPIILEGS